MTVTDDLTTTDVMEAEGRRVTPRQRAIGVVLTGAVLFGGGYLLQQRDHDEKAARAGRVESMRDQARRVLPDSGVVVASGVATDLAAPQLISTANPMEPGRYRLDVVCIGSGTIEVDVTIGGSGQASMLRCKQTALPQSAEIEVPESATGLVVERGATTGEAVAWQVVRL